jgi:transcriptional regulator with XRE-family HTH domain
VAAQLIRTARAGAKLSQRALAEQLGVTQQTVAKWEVGENRPTMDNLVRLSEVVPSFDLFGAVEALWPTVAQAAADSGATNARVVRRTRRPAPDVEDD